jgi:hypothetical protein
MGHVRDDCCWPVDCVRVHDADVALQPRLVCAREPKRDYLWTSLFVCPKSVHPKVPCKGVSANVILADFRVETKPLS